MICNQCGTENQDGVKFCAGCGSVVDPEFMPEPAQPKAPRPARAPKAKTPFGMLQLLVAVFTLLALTFGVCHLFVDYVVAGKAVQISKSEDDGKTISKADCYYFKSNLYNESQEALDEEKELLEESKEALEENREQYENELAALEEMGADEETIREMRREFETETKITGTFTWIKLANILGGIGCILLSAVGVLYLLRGMVPVYDMAFGKLFRGRSALTVMGLGGVVFSVLQMALNSLTKIRYVRRFDGDLDKATMSLNVHWTVWAMLILSVLFVIYDVTMAKPKKK